MSQRRQPPQPPEKENRDPREINNLIKPKPDKCWLGEVFLEIMCVAGCVVLAHRSILTKTKDALPWDTERTVIDFSQVIAEPTAKGIRSFDMNYEFVGYCYECWKDCCYGLMTLLCGCWMAMYWGISFGVLAFPHIWCYTPCIISVKLCIQDVFQRCFKAILDCCITPWTTSCTGLFRMFYVKRVPKTPEVKAKPQVKTVPLPVVKTENKPTTPRKEDNFHNLYLGTEKNMTATIQRTLGLYLNSRVAPKQHTTEEEDMPFE